MYLINKKVQEKILIPALLIFGFAFILSFLMPNGNTGQLSLEADKIPGKFSELDKKAFEVLPKLPLAFETNQGQVDRKINFLSRGNGYGFYISPSEAIIALRENGISKAGESEQESEESVLKLKVIGANDKAKIVGEDKLLGRSNYFIGRHSKDWYTDIPTFSRVKLMEVLPGVDQVYYGNQGQLEYDFIVKPGARANDIKLKIEGAENILIADNGELIISVEGKEVRQQKPLVYQESETGKNFIAGNYVVHQNGEIGFEIGEYDDRKTLVIDPILVYSSYLGGNHSDGGNNIVVDSEKNIYLIGTTASTNFPTSNPIQPTKADSGFSDVFVAKINSSGTAIIYSTYLGGALGDAGYGIDVDATGNAYLTGVTSSNNFPVVNAYDSSFNGTDDIFLVKLNPTGSGIVYSTYLGGDNTDIASEVKVDKASGEAILACSPLSSQFPRTPGGFDQYCPSCTSGAFITRFNSQGNAIINSTLVPASVNDLALDSSGNIYITGSANRSIFPTTPGSPRITCDLCVADAFIAKLNQNGTTLIYSALFGGSQHDFGKSITVDSAGNAYITGTTESYNLSLVPFPTTTGSFQPQATAPPAAFVTKLNPSGTDFVYSTFLSGTGGSYGFGIAADSLGNAYITGRGNILPTLGGFPLKNPFGYLPGQLNGIFISVLNPSGSSLIFSSFLGGGTGHSVVTDNAGGVYITGQALYDTLLTVNAIQPNPGLGNDVRDAFFTKIRIDLGSPVARPDFDGNNRADISVYRNGIWYMLDNNGNFRSIQFGLSTDRITPADFDGDGKTDIAVFRDGVWYWTNSSTGSVGITHFGSPGDIPVPADYSGDGRSELAVYRNGQWWSFNLATYQTNLVNFGLASDRPVVGDYDGDGRVDQAVYRGNGEWHLNRSSEGYAVVNFGLATDKLVVGDYDGDGRTDPAVYRDGVWYLLQSTSGVGVFQWGIPSDIPVPADYDGDGRTDPAVYRNGVWYLLQSTSGISIQQFGLPGDKPVATAL